jgi:DNA-directed RNA polymerase specialized sigma24 family protein
MISSKGSVTHWLGELKAGDPDAAQKLWQRYFEQLVGLARQKLQGIPRRVAGEEDVALSVFDTFCRAFQCGRYPQLSDRDGLWRLLVVLTAHKSVNLVRRGHTKKRSARSSILTTGAELAQIVDQQPTPEFATQVAEEFERLLDRLGDDQLRALALWKMEGFTNEEIAAKLSCVVRTVERRLRVIRSIWRGERGSTKTRTSR